MCRYSYDTGGLITKLPRLVVFVVTISFRKRPKMRNDIISWPRHCTVIIAYGYSSRNIVSRPRSIGEAILICIN